MQIVVLFYDILTAGKHEKEALTVDHRSPLKLNTVLAFEGMSCQIEDVVGQGSNAIVYKGWYQDSLNRELRHHVLVKELFPFHPQQRIYRAEDGHIVIEPEAEELWETHKESFEIGNRVHLRLLYDHPDMMVMGANLNSFQFNGTLYSVLGYTGGRSLQAELNKTNVSLRHTAQRMIGLLDALEAFHKSGYLHLDISPDNIMLVGQEEQERIFLIDYNSAREVGSRDSNYLSCKAGYSAPEVSTGNLDAMGFASDLYSVAAVFFRCIMGRSLTLAEMLQPKAPDCQDSPLLKDMPQTVSAMVGNILKKGLHTLSRRRYQSIGQMRQAFQELLDRIDCVGVTHWSLWENGKRSVEELIKINPSLRYLKDEKKLYPIRLEQEYSMSLERYLDNLLSPEGKSGIILAQGGMGKTTLLLHTAMLQGKRYSAAAPAIFYISLNGWDKADTKYIRSQILMRLRFKKDENTFDSAMHALHKLLEQPIKTKQGNVPTVLLLLDGLNEVRGDITPLVQEINELSKMTGVRILATSRSEVLELGLETASLMPLNVEDIEEALGRNGLLIPQKQDVIQLLRTPLILSIYIQASEGGRQLNIRNEDELMKSYMGSLLEKEIRELPEGSPLRWQIDVALNYVLPAVAIEMKRKSSTLSREQLLKVVTCCWNTLNTRAFRKTYPHWIGHGPDIRVGAKTPEEWFGIVLDSLLWQRLGLLTKGDTDGYRIYHQAVAEYFAGYRIPMANKKAWLTALIALLLCAVAVAGYWHQETVSEQQAAEMQIQKVLELGATGYVEYGELYRQLSDLINAAVNGNAEHFRMYYDRVLAVLESEQIRTPSEETESRQIESTSDYDQLLITWGNQDAPYEYEILMDIFDYPDERAAFYLEQLPLLKTWIESETIQRKNPNFADILLDLMEADANLAAEMYHRSVGIHLSGTDSVWLGNMNALVAMIPDLDSHRDTSTQEDRGQKLSTLHSIYLKANGKFETERSRLSAYIRNMAAELQTDTIDIQTQLEQISVQMKADNQLAEAEGIDEVVIALKERQTIANDIFSYIMNANQE